MSFDIAMQECLLCCEVKTCLVVSYAVNIVAMLKDNCLASVARQSVAKLYLRILLLTAHLRILQLRPQQRRSLLSISTTGTLDRYLLLFHLFVATHIIKCRLFPNRAIDTTHTHSFTSPPIGIPSKRGLGDEADA